MTTQLTIDFKAVAYARFFWKSRLYGDERRTKPTYPTVHGQPIPPGVAIPYLQDYPEETTLERARRRELLDEWIPTCILQLRNNHSLSFVGNKATKIWKAYNAHIYGTKN